ncbi:MAG: pyridoxamine 5'-phosphate oxidase family protein [Oscillospiraceae bacterium]|nr:pyridoxamine 5'-phosphate oxidase family protein [Oscillospiraceae bacterium]
MDRPVRRSDRMISVEDAIAVLKAADYGFLSTVSSDGSPYGIPLSFVYINDALYFHCAPEGHKLDNILQNPEVCFCAVSQAETLADKFSVRYASAAVFGTAEVIKDDTEKRAALVALIEKYSPGHIPAGMDYINRDFHKPLVVKITIQKISGKARK